MSDETPTPVRPDRPHLTRSRTNRIIGGVCAGLATYLGVDAVVVRIAFVVLALAGGGGVLLYVIAWILIPEEEPGASPWAPRDPPAAGESARLVLGAILIAVGAILLVDLLVPSLSRFFWPAALIAVGIVIIVASSARRR